MKISEIFFSIQGESTSVGLPCIFIRLAGCNLKCRWCDTTYAHNLEQGEDYSIEQIISMIKRINSRLVEISGGEALIQEQTPLLLNELLNNGYETLLETNGSINLEHVNKHIIKIIDVKCPSSAQDGSFLMENIKFIGRTKELKD